MCSLAQRQANARRYDCNAARKLNPKAACTCGNHLPSTPASNNQTVSNPVSHVRNSEVQTMPVKLSASEHREIIDARVELRMASHKTVHARLRLLPDPLGINPKLQVSEDTLRAQFRAEEEAKYYSNIKASASAPAMRLLPDPLGLRALGMNPDGTVNNTPIDLSNPSLNADGTPKEYKTPDVSNPFHKKQ